MSAQRQLPAMSIHLVEGVVTAVERSPSGILFSIGERRFTAPPEPQAYALEGGQFVHVLAAEGLDGEADEVLVMKWAGAEPVYFGPRMGWPYLLLGATLFSAAIVSGNLFVIIVPLLLGLVHCDFLARRARVFARFAQELSSRLAIVSVAVDAPPAEATPGAVVDEALHGTKLHGSNQRRASE
jgi:hypothetical protein